MNSIFKKSNMPVLLMVLCVLLFFVVQIVFVWDGGQNQVFNSPDANANYHFSLRLFQGQSLGVTLPFEESFARPYLSTRSTRVIGSTIVPTGFLGIIYICGFLSSLFFVNIIPYITIFFASIALIFIYKLIADYFSKWTAFFSVFLIAIHPAWWYYSNDSMMPNVLFVSLFIIGFYILTMMRGRSRLFVSCSAALILSLAVFVRMSEIIWIVPIIVFYLIINRRAIHKNNITFFSVVFLLLCACALSISYASLNYGGVIGYSLITTDAHGFFDRLSSFLLPFGFHPRTIILNTWNYGFRFFWPYTIGLAIAACSIICKIRKNRTILFYLLSVSFISVLLFIFYGSWYIVDTPDPSSVTIGTSYVRYFLPFYIFTAPFIVYGCHAFQRFMTRSSYITAICISLFIVASISFYISFFSQGDGIIQKSYTLKTYDTIASMINQHTEKESIIVADKGDKYVWPGRLVISKFDTEESVKAIAYFAGNKNKMYFLTRSIGDDKISQYNLLWAKESIKVGQRVFTYADTSLYDITMISNDEN